MDKIKQIGFKAGEKPKRPVIQEDTSASKSYASIAYGISEGEIVGLIDGAKSVYLDGTPVESVSGDVNIPDVKIQERKGTNDQTHLEGFPAVVNEKQYNNIEMLQTTPFVHYINDTNLDAVGIRFTFGALQSTNPDNGNVSGTVIDYAIDVQADGQGYQELLRTSIVGKYSSGYQRYHRIELPQADEGWEVRIRRITANTTSTYIADKMYLDAVAEILDVKMRYPNTALIGLKFDSERFSNIPKVDFRMRGKIIRVPANYDPVARTYAQSGAGTTNGIWNGQFKMAYTTNPAWIFYDLVLNRRYGLGNRIDASMLDKWSLYSIAQYCDVMVPDGEGGLEPRFTCNVYINNRFEAYDCLMQLAGVFRGIMYWSGTAIIAGCDRPQDPVFTYTRANIIGEFNYSGTRTKDRHSVVMVSFDDPRNSYKTEKEVVSDRKAISEIGIRTKDLAAFACTSRGQAQRAGKWALFKEQLETRIVTFALGMDGYIAPVGRIIEIADPLLAGRAIGGRIAAVSADKTTITLDRDTEVKVGDRLVLNNEEGEQESRQVTSVSGRAVTVAVAFESPAVEHVWAIDSDDLQLMRFTVISVAENRSQDSINFTVTALQHEPDLHEAADYSAYIDRNTYSAIDITTQKAPAEVLISSVNRINQGIDLTDLVISWKQAENAVKYHVQWRRDDGNWIQMPLQYGNQVTVENIYHGVYEAKVVAINAADVNSLPASSAPTPINSKFAEPEVLASLTANGILFGVELNWKFPLYGAQNAAFVEIYWALNGDKSDEKLLGSYAYPTTETTLNGLSPHQTLYFRARLVDRNGVASGFTPWVTATVIADPEKLLDMLNGHIGLEAIDEELSKAIEDNTAGVSDAKALADQAKTDAANAQTTATNAGAAAADAAGKATAAANAVAKEVTDRVAAVTAETNARTAALTKEATDRATALTTQSNTLKADSAAKVKALKDEVDPKITTLQNGITQVTTDYKAADTAVVGQINAYKTSNDSAVASVLQKAESAVATGSTNSSAITAINGQIATINNTKLDASVIAGYYTKGQTDAKAAEIAAGKVEEYDASLVIGGTNLQPGTQGGNFIPYNGQPFTEKDGEFKTKIVRFDKVASGGRGITMAYPMNKITLIKGNKYLLSFYVKGTLPVNYAYIMSATESGANSSLFPVDESKVNDTTFTKVELPFTAKADRNNASVMISSIGPEIGWLEIAEIMFQEGTKATPWEPSYLDTQTALDANSTAIQNTNAEVSRVDGVATAANNATTALSGRVSAVEGSVSTKAEAAALTALTTRVTSAEGVNTSQGSAITTLQNSVNHATTGLASKASSAALTAVDNKVTAANGRIDTTNSNVTALTGRVDTVEGAVSTKAEAAALTSLTTRVSNAEGVNTTQGTAITSLENSVNHATTGLATKASSSALTAVDNKVTAANGRIDTTNSNVTTLTGRVSTVEGDIAKKADASALSALTTRVETEEGKSTSQGSAITALQNTINHATTGLATKAASSALTAVDNKVTAANGRIDTTNSNVTKLTGRVSTVEGDISKKADASALNSLTTRVETEEGKSTSQGTAITALQNSVNHATTGLATKASSAALTTVDNRVTTVDGRVNTTNSNVAALTGRVSTVEGGLTTKADVAAMNALTTRVGNVEGGLSTQASDMTALKSSLSAGAMDTLVIGGNEAKTKTGGYLAVQYQLSKPVLVGKTYTIRAKVSFSNGGNAAANLRFYLGGQTAFHPSGGITSAAEDIIEVSAVASAAGTAQNVSFYCFPNSTANANAVTTVHWVEVYEGSNLTLNEKASAAALSTTNTEVSRINDVVSGHVTDIRNLTTSIAGKADASALNSLTARVATEEGKSTSQGTAITNLQNAVNHSTTGLASKASSSALTTLNNQVQHSTTGLSAVNTKVDNLKATVEHTTNGLASKASSSALDTLSNKVNHSTTGLDAIASKTTVLESDVAKALDVVTISDTRSTNQPPSWYWANYSKRTVNEFKTQTVIGVGGFFGGTYCNLETNIPYGDSSGGHIVQTATSANDPSLYVQRVSTSTTAWGAWAQPIKDLRDGLAGKAAASAVESLTTRVTTAEGKIGTEATKLTNLSTTVGNHTTSIATQTTTIDGIQAKHTVKINNNGFVTGYGLISTANNGAIVSAFKVDADAFAVGKSGSGILPFVVTTAGQTISGIKYPAAGTWINAAYIASATIGTAHITDLAVKTAKIDNLAVTTAKIGNLQVDTLKIKDNAVTVPIGVKLADKQYSAPAITAAMNAYAEANGWIVWKDGVGRWDYPKTLAGTISLYEIINAPVFSITVPRAGGKCRIDISVMVTNNGANFNNVSPSGQPESVLRDVRLFLSLYRGTTLIGRTSLAPTSFGNSQVGYAGNMALMALDDVAVTGNTTYVAKLSFGYLGTLTNITVGNSATGLLKFEQIVGSALEIKK